MPSQLPFLCTRCDKGFRSASAKQQHIRDSDNHYLCYICPQKWDYETQRDLNNHLESAHHICTACNPQRQFRTSSQLDQHDVDKHNMCSICRRYFRTIQNLKMHKITHAERDIECAGCYRLFVTESAMLLHLEAGTCPSDTDRYDVTQFGQNFYYAYECQSTTPGYEFHCPTCECDFNLMSALVQHVESDACEESLDEDRPLGQFLEHIRSRLG